MGYCPSTGGCFQKQKKDFVNKMINLETRDNQAIGDGDKVMKEGGTKSYQ